MTAAASNHRFPSDPVAAHILRRLAAVTAAAGNRRLPSDPAAARILRRPASEPPPR